MLRALEPPSALDLIDALTHARALTLDLARDVDESIVLGPCLPIINCALWEFGHVGWFQERWLLRRDGHPPLRPLADAWYDSSAVPHGTRWDLPMPTWRETLEDLERILELSLRRLTQRPLTEEDTYFASLCVFHEDMHHEAFLWTRQVLGQPGFHLSGTRESNPKSLIPTGDADFPAGTLHMGCRPQGGFVFDNEQGCHEVFVEPFSMARTPVSETEYADFVDDSGYSDPRWWTLEGWAWRTLHRVDKPLYWYRDSGWRRRVFDRGRTLRTDRPMIHVSAHEAEAWCRWAGRRLPTEVEWEAAARGYGPNPRIYPWGDEFPGSDRAHLDLRGGDTASLTSCSSGDSPEGLRHLLGNVWEWTATPFESYPGFKPGPYADYSKPWFGTHRVLRGGSWAAKSRLIHGAYRNFFLPDRRDILAGFRTCAL